MNRTVALWSLLLAIPVLLLTGCNGLYKPTAIITVSAERAMQSWANYYDAAINDPAAYGTTEASLIDTRKKVDERWEKYREAMNLFDDTRQDFLVNKATDSDVMAALKAGRDQGQALALFIIDLLPPQFKPAGLNHE